MLKVKFTGVTLLVLLTLTACHSWRSNGVMHAGLGAQITPYSSGSNVGQYNDPAVIWQTLQHKSRSFLIAEAQHSTDPVYLGWLKLAILNREYNKSYAKLIAALQQWQAEYRTHPAKQLMPTPQRLTELANFSQPRKFAVLLPKTGPFAREAQVISSGFLRAYYQHNRRNIHKQTITFYDTAAPNAISEVYRKAVADGAEVIIGPVTKDNVLELVKFQNFPVPTLTLNYLQINCSNTGAPNLYQFGFAPEHELQQLATIMAHKNLHHAVIITLDNPWGKQAAQTFAAQWQELGGTLMPTMYLAPNANFDVAIAGLFKLNPRINQDQTKAFEVGVLLLPANIGRQVVPLLKFYYDPELALYANSTIYNNVPNPVQDRDLNNVKFTVVPWLVYLAQQNLPTTIPEMIYSPLYALGYDSYLLGNNLALLPELANFPLAGATGQLMLHQQCIYQKLMLATIHNGHITTPGPKN